MQSVPEALQETIASDLGERFRIESLLGSGTHSHVYLADEVASGRPVALKVVPLTPEQGSVNLYLAAVFERVAAAAADLRHSHLVPIYGFGTSPAYLWYAMEYAGERSLADMLRDEGRLDLDKCLRVMEQVASALDFMHRRGVAHGNLKPTHVFIDSGNWIRLSDLNLTRLLDVWRAIEASEPETVALEEGVAEQPDSPPETLLWRAIELGGPGTLALEEAVAKHLNSPRETFHADLRALASLAYECLSGTGAAPGDDQQETEPTRRSKGPVPLSEIRPDIPAPVAYAIQRVLMRERYDERADVLEFVTALHGGIQVPRPAQAARVDPLTRDRPRVLMFDQFDQPRSQFAGLRRIRDAARILATKTAGTVRQKQFSPKEYIIGFSALAIAVVAISVWQLRPTEELESPSPVYELMAPQTPAETPTLEDAQPDEPRAEITADQSEPREAETTPQVSEADESSSPAARVAPQPGRAAGASATAAAPGLLSVNATPWGELYVDGQPVGNTPMLNFAIAAGTHVIRIVRDGFEPYEAEIRVAAGQELRLTNIVLRQRQP